MDLNELLWGAADMAVVEAKRAFLDAVDGLTERCDSPIEKVLFAYCYAGLRDHGSVHFQAETVTWPNTLYPDMKRGDIAIYTQAAIGPYRADLLMEVALWQDLRVWIAVECDGHDFHERTKEQAARDRKRDREMQALGVIVMRFTGSEIWRDPTKCVLEIIKMYGAAADMVGK